MVGICNTFLDTNYITWIPCKYYLVYVILKLYGLRRLQSREHGDPWGTSVTTFLVQTQKTQSVLKTQHSIKRASIFATPFVTSTIYSVLTMWTLVITSAQFTRQNCNLRTLPHLLLKCVISTHISRQAIQPHLSVSASTIRGMTLRSGLSTFLIWTATFPPIQLTVFIYRNWWDMLEFALPKLTSWIDSADFPYVSDNKVFSPLYFNEHLQNSSIGMVLSSWNMVQPCGRWDLPSRLE